MDLSVLIEACRQLAALRYGDDAQHVIFQPELAHDATPSGAPGEPKPVSWIASTRSMSLSDPARQRDGLGNLCGSGSSPLEAARCLLGALENAHRAVDRRRARIHGQLVTQRDVKLALDLKDLDAAAAAGEA